MEHRHVASTPADWGLPIHPWVAEGQRRIRFGIGGGPGADWRAAVEWVQMVEDLGFDSYWVTDHPVGSSFECWTRLAAMAAVTKRIRLGPLVACVDYRHPALLARQAADVDRLSGGRLLLGLGIGDVPWEYAALGLPYRSSRERQGKLEELLQVLPLLWSEAPATFEGRHVRLDGVRLSPGPVQQPRVPVLIAGGGERVTLRQVAQYADASNFGAGNLTGNAWSADDVRRKYDVLRGHCATLGRPFESVLRTHVSYGLKLTETGAPAWERIVDAKFDFEFDRLAGTPRDAIAYYRALAAAGVQYFIVNMVADEKTLRLLAGEVVPEVVGG